MRKKIFCLVGRTSTGKSTIARELCRRFGFLQVKSYTTRPPRESELAAGLDKSDHLFISDKEFDYLKDIAAYTEINGFRYCTTYDILDECDIYVIDPDGIKYMKEKMADRYDVYEFYIESDAVELQKRYKQRGGSDFEQRYSAENAQFAAYEENIKKNPSDHIFVFQNRNGFLDETVNYIKNIMTHILYGDSEIESLKQAIEEEFTEYKLQILQLGAGKVFDMALNIAKIMSIKNYVINNPDERMVMYKRGQDKRLLFAISDFESYYNTPMWLCWDDLSCVVNDFFSQNMPDY